MRAAFAEGIGWGDAKQKLFERIDAEIAPLRERYETLISEPARIEEQLRHGAAKARTIATPLLVKLRDAVGLRNLSAKATMEKPGKPKSAMPQFKQYRENDGKFYFKLIDGEDHVLLQSIGFASPKDAGAVVARMKSGSHAPGTFDSSIVRLAGVDDADIVEALHRLQQGD
jgi:tryptophanyl-tRNA synthetase